MTAPGTGLNSTAEKLATLAGRLTREPGYHSFRTSPSARRSIVVCDSTERVAYYAIRVNSSFATGLNARSLFKSTLPYYPLAAARDVQVWRSKSHHALHQLVS